jgi:hypothetical protein
MVMKQLLLVIASLLFLFSPVADAKKMKKQPPRWHEAHGEIVLDSVCEDFAYGSLEYRDCRSATQRLFRDRCSDYRAKAEQSGGARREEYQRQQDKYCTAASQFGPVN